MTLLLAVPLSWAQGQEVTWVSSAPLAVPQGEETMDSRQIDFLIRHLPKFTHHIVRVSPARSLYDLRHGEAMCTVGVLVTPERETAMLFAARRMVLPSFRLMVPRDRLSSWAAALTPGGEIDLDKIEGSAIGGYTNSRNYDPAIADFIQRRGGKGMESMVATFQLFNLMQANRIDFAFVMPPDLYFYGPKQDRQQLALLPIKSVVPTSDASVACTRDETGRSVIKAIDALMADETHWAEFVEPFRNWVPPEDFIRLLGTRLNVDRVP